MRIASWVISALLAGQCWATPSGETPLPGGGSLRYAVKGGRTRFEIRTADGKRGAVTVPRDEHVAPKSAPLKVEVIGRTEQGAVILTDSYPSKPGGMSYCQAGQERFLRVIAAGGQPPQQTLQLKLESCRENLELAEGGLEWQPESGVVRVRWLPGPGREGKTLERTIRINPQGKPQ